jgi:hypothetical protein
VSSNISPDSKWKVVIEDNKVKWIQLGKKIYRYTTEELVQATKNIDPDLWK